ncbi:MAG: hypothetical protein HQ553_04460 [Chloroflexi bacterium]|nr:hypothetical protein [Chloroflexota bacterium]
MINIMNVIQTVMKRRAPLKVTKIVYVEVPDINERLSRLFKILIDKPSEKENATTINPVMIVRGLFDRFPRIGVDHRVDLC